MSDYISLIEQCDPSIFLIDSQTSGDDRRSLLDIQNIVRLKNDRYTYLEVGSHLGGTLVPHLLDPRCGAVMSVDPRPASQPDERGCYFDYDDNSTARMIHGLGQVVPRAGLLKLRTFDSDISDLLPDQVGVQANLALIDGEHTNRACFRDFVSILGHMAADCVIVFHDSDLIYDALLNIETFLQYEKRHFTSVYLKSTIYAIGLGSMAVAVEPLRRDAFDPQAYVAGARDRLHSRIAAQRAATIDIAA